MDVLIADLHLHPPTPPPALHIHVSVPSTTTSLNGTSPLHRCARLVLGEFPVQTKLSPPSPSPSDSSPSASPSIHRHHRRSSLLPLPPPPLQFHTIEHAAWCSSHSLASQTLDIFSADSYKYTSALSRRRLPSAKTQRLGDRQQSEREGEEESSSSRAHRTQGKGSIFIY